MVTPQKSSNAQCLPAGNAFGTPLERLSRRLGRVCMGLPATAAVADMPVGAPPPFASALEQAADGTRTSGARSGSAVTVEEPVPSDHPRPKEDMHDHPKLSCYTSPVLAPAISGWPFSARVHHSPAELDFACPAM